MPVGAFVSVDTPTANPFQRDSFETAMAERHWVPHQEGFLASIAGAESDEIVVQTIEQSISECLADAGIEDWDAVCVISEDQPAQVDESLPAPVPVSRPWIAQFAMN